MDSSGCKRARQCRKAWTIYFATILSDTFRLSAISRCVFPSNLLSSKARRHLGDSSRMATSNWATRCLASKVSSADGAGLAVSSGGGSMLSAPPTGAKFSQIVYREIGRDPKKEGSRVLHID